MGSLPAAALLLFATELKGDLRAGARVTQRAGELPTGAVGPAGGTSLFSYDTELQPELRLRLADERLTASLFYDPRFLLRVQFPEGEGAQTLDAGGRPFLIQHSVRGTAGFRIAPRWTWSGTLQGIFGEQDFAQFAQEGAGAGGEAGGTVASPVISSTSFSLDTAIVGPLVGRNDFRTTGTFTVTYPEAEVGEGAVPVEPAPGDVLCFVDVNEETPVGAVAGGIADTCQMGLSTATVSPLSDLDQLEARVGYEAIDLDPGPYVHAASADVLWRRRFSRALEGRLRAGGILAVDANPVTEDEDPISFLPIADLGFAWRLVNLRLFRLSLDVDVGLDGFVEAVTRRYLSRAQGTASLSAVIRRDVNVGLRVSAFTLAPWRDCPPRQPLMADIRLGGCPDDLTPAERSAEIPDLSSFSSELSLTWRVDQHVSVRAAARYAFRARHPSRWGTEPVDTMMMEATPGQSQREISGQLGLRVVYGTNNDLGS